MRELLRITESQLRRVVRQVLRESAVDSHTGELPPPDAPGLDAEDGLGQWAMPHLRTDPAYQRVDEPDSDLEWQLVRGLRAHYDENEDARLARIWDELLDLRDRGLYSDLLEPPQGHAYRFMMLSPDRAALFLGVPEETIMAAPAGEAQPAPSPPRFLPRGLIASWTMDPLGMTRAELASVFISREPGEVAVVLRARTSQSAFLLNPARVGRDWNLASHLAFEAEVLSGGPVELDGAAWAWFPPEDVVRHHLMRDVIGAQRVLRGQQVQLAAELVDALP